MNQARRRVLEGLAATAAVSGAPRWAGAQPPSCAMPAAADFRPTLFELRSYRARPGKRDALLDMFEGVFLDAYQAAGARILGTFRSLDDPQRWVWIRAFADAPSRGTALGSFYGGSTWKDRAEACNATIDEVSPALLLREPQPGPLGMLCAPGREAAVPACLYVIAVHPLARAAEAAFAALYESEARPLLEALGGRPAALLVSDHRENSYPRQPVRPGSVGVVLTRFDSEAQHRRFLATRTASHAWRARVEPQLARLRSGPLESMRLWPSARSALR